jgi:hypothetical protein
MYCNEVNSQRKLICSLICNQKVPSSILGIGTIKTEGYIKNNLLKLVGATTVPQYRAVIRNKKKPKRTGQSGGLVSNFGFNSSPLGMKAD